MNTRPDRDPPLAVTLFWLALAACSCLLTRWAAELAGADWRLSTALAIGAGLATLLIGGMCCTASGRDGRGG